METSAGRGKSPTKHGIFHLLIIITFAIMGCSGNPTDHGSRLEAGFKNPPGNAKPRVWWHWMNGNITKAGIKADLEWMKRVGFGGFQSFDANITTPQIVDKRLIYMTPEWKDAFLYSTKLADSLGLEMAIAGSPGWSESGGPWVTPERAMKKLVWSRIRLDGGRSFTGKLPVPPTTTGIFQNIALGNFLDPSPEKLPEYYADAAVIAYKIPANDLTLSELDPAVTSSAGKPELSQLTDGDLARTVFLPAATGNEKAWIKFEFKEPMKVSSLTLVCIPTGFNGHESEVEKELEISDDNIIFKPVFVIPQADAMEHTFSFEPVSARFFRIAFINPAQMGVSSGNAAAPVRASDKGIKIAEIVLHTISRVNRFEDKAGYTPASGLYAYASAPVPSGDAVDKSEVIDLTSKMHPDGTLDWTPGEGRWEVIRFGYTLTGHRNAPASPEATGLEVDKLNAGYVKSYFENYLDQYINATGGMMGEKGLHYIITDSWEAGVQNWTDSMMTEFSKRRGYDMLHWMPVLTGQIVGSAEESDRFLWDFRKTISDLTTENHYDQLTTILHNRNMERYTESHEYGRSFIADGMEVKRKADIPMSAMWTPNNVGGKLSTGYKADVRESASVSHIYGQNFVAVESMTSYGSPWAWSPEFLKPTADIELANGANRFVQSVSVHSPSEVKLPGLSLGPFGPWLNRHETWAEQANPWMMYLTRSSFMLQQGRNIADIIYYYGDDNNITALFANKLPDIPCGYNYDFVNSDAIVNVISVEKGQIITPGGARYKLLALDPNCSYMTLPVLRKISGMVKAGAVVVGEKPLNTPSLSDDQGEFNTIVNELWANAKSENIVGKGKVYEGCSVNDALKLLKVDPDFGFTKPHDDTEVLFVHHKLDDIDFYWINNRNGRNEDITANFRVTGRIPEIWHPETGEIENASYSMAEGRTIVPLRLVPDDAIFVVFRNKTNKSSETLKHPEETQLAIIDGPWNLGFQPGRGAPSEIVVDKLISWSENIEPGIKYFSGTGTYSKVIQAPDSWFKKDLEIWVDLGDVKNIAEVIVNGKSLGIIWKKPFRINITQDIKQGENKLEIKVTNLWVNRLIGDQQPGVTKKISYTSAAYYSSGTPLLPSGLIGPVAISGISKK